MKLWFTLLGCLWILAPGQEQASDWAGIWEGLGQLIDARSAEEPDTEHVVALAEDLIRRAQATGDEGRTAILKAHVLGGRLVATRVPEDLVLGEARWAAPVLEPGKARAEAYARALVEARGDDAQYGELIAMAFDAFVEDVEDLRVEPAEILALAMHETAQASWSAVSLALWSTRVGEHERADRVLEERLALAGTKAERVDLLQRRGIAALGAGRLEDARDFLGRAMAQGGTDAVQILARAALSEGEKGRARRLFGALLVKEDPYGATPWALRGWSLSLLPGTE